MGSLLSSNNNLPKRPHHPTTNGQQRREKNSNNQLSPLTGSVHSISDVRLGYRNGGGGKRHNTLSSRQNSKDSVGDDDDDEVLPFDLKLRAPIYYSIPFFLKVLEESHATHASSAMEANSTTTTQQQQRQPLLSNNSKNNKKPSQSLLSRIISFFKSSLSQGLNEGRKNKPFPDAINKTDDPEATYRSARTLHFFTADAISKTCKLDPFPTRTSLVTFHKPNANPVNRSQAVAANKVSVVENDLISFYCNIDNGRYGRIEDVKQEMGFVYAPKQIKKTSPQSQSCDFYIRRAAGWWDCSEEEKQQREPDELYYGDEVVFESYLFPGKFLSFDATTKVGLTLKDVGTVFCPSSPALAELLQIQNVTEKLKKEAKQQQQEEDEETPATSEKHDYSHFLHSPPTNRHDDDFLSEEELYKQALLEEQDQQLMRRMTALPVHLVCKIFSFKPRFLQMARQVNHGWKQLAERFIKSIRVNGEFASLETRGEIANFIRFIANCPNLRHLTLRNVGEMEDGDFAEFVRTGRNNGKLTKLALGGCRRLTDRSTELITKNFPNLKVLNLASTSVTNESLLLCANRLKHLKHLNFYGCAIDGEVFVNFEGKTKNASPDPLPMLESINLRGTLIRNQNEVIEFSFVKPKVNVLLGPAVDSIFG